MGKKNSSMCRVRHIRRAAGIIAAFCIFLGIVHALNYIYAGDSEWERILWHNFYEDKGRIDNLYLGTSHVYSDINPMILDKLNGEYNFNLSTSAQSMNGTFYLLKEADRNNELKHVYVELYYYGNVKNEFGSDSVITEPHRNWANTDYMKISINKLAYMLSIAGPEKYSDVFLPFSRYRVNLNNLGQIRQKVDNKCQHDYLTYMRHYEFDDGNGYEEYQRQGYINYTRVNLADETPALQDRILNYEPMGETAEKYLYKIMDYCQKRNIPVTLFVSSIGDLKLISTEGYDYYIDQVSGIAEEYQGPFYDFNLVKEEYLSLNLKECYRDEGHLNCFGAEIFTSFFNEVVSGDESENQKYFYNSYAEKLQETVPTIYGLYYQYAENMTETLEVIRVMHVASNRTSGMEYKITLTPDEGEQYVVQDFDENKEFTIPYGEKGICTIVARMKESPEEIQTMEILY